MDIRKPLIRQAGSADALAGSTATGRELVQDRIFRTNCQQKNYSPFTLLTITQKTLSICAKMMYAGDEWILRHSHLVESGSRLRHPLRGEPCNGCGTPVW